LLPVKLRAFIDFAVPRLEQRLRSIEMSIGAGALSRARSPAKQRGRKKTS
jgi:hypothetical protein